MPVTRRSTGGGRARPGPEKGQSTISFATRVTKASAPIDAKKAVLSEPAPKKAEVQTPANDEVEEVEEEATEEEEEVEQDDPVQKVSAPEPDVPVDAEKDESDLLAERMTDAEIKKYWSGIQNARIAAPVHQEDLTISEQILRYFDVSSQYGPSIGINRTRRWKRAERLGLNPPIEVLAVLMKEEKNQPGSTEVSSMDQIMNHIAAGA
ncbi:hypothetical protein jhhlp_005617 [Lomentospora prolificans]|uniref:DNA polymerase delta subunit 4 n=1 Tax=Lomentospora prolificans TaxID=41688 RepID=A0A2N3N3K4_9PEZI|nr:hypothetical protein jhhlp_005617 [Lomentospora prolificans]